ncbi:MAG: hypothetical protein OEM26_09945 [Saprospiraceae bacterium]|nr:hypothetical protein [Saprospiraceae bacterium]
MSSFGSSFFVGAYQACLYAKGCTTRKLNGVKNQFDFDPDFAIATDGQALEYRGSS